MHPKFLSILRTVGVALVLVSASTAPLAAVPGGDWVVRVRQGADYASALSRTGQVEIIIGCGLVDQVWLPELIVVDHANWLIQRQPAHALTLDMVIDNTRYPLRITETNAPYYTTAGRLSLAEAQRNFSPTLQQALQRGLRLMIRQRENPTNRIAVFSLIGSAKSMNQALRRCR